MRLKKTKVVNDLNQCEQLLSVATTEEVEQSDLTELQNRVSAAKLALTSVTEPVEPYGMEVVIPQYTPEQYKGRLDAWKAAEDARLAAKSTDISEDKGEVKSSGVNAARESKPEESLVESTLQTNLEAYHGPIIACTTAKTESNHTRALNVPTYNLTIDSAIKHIRRVGPTVAIGQASSKDTNKGVKRKFGEVIVSEQPTMI